ncbi:MAG: YARHG domain-containing protein [Flavobacteriaceae bacterium]|nr:YARHG domain-containing protein [Flavobacteriaceae bacterium]
MNKIILTLCCVMAFSCGKDKPKKEIIEAQFEASEDDIETRLAQEEEDEPLRQIEFAHKEEVAAYVQQLDSVYNSLSYYAQTYEGLLFYVGNKGKTWEKYGIVNQQMKEILPVEYDEIFNPDLTVKDYVEIRKRHLVGLVNYTNGHLVPCEFDIIYPPIGDEIAIGKIEQIYYKITESGKEEILNDNEKPRNADIFKTLSFDYFDKSVVPLNDPYYEHYEGDPYEGNGVVFTPTYLNQFGVLPEKVENILNAEEGFGLIESRSEVNQSKGVGDKIFAFITNFFEEGVDGRGYELEKQHLVTINTENEDFYVKRIHESYNDNAFHFCGDEVLNMHFISDNVLEVKKYIQNSESYKRYHSMPIYLYYQIKDNGEIEQFGSNRVFGFTKQKKLKREDFYDCFTREKNKSDGGFGLYLTSHYSIEDLDIMRNEIFAEYGYKFKTDKWIAYFDSKPWYEPKHDNVDDLLSEIEKHNVTLILEVKNELNEKGDELLKEKETYVWVAG